MTNDFLDSLGRELSAAGVRGRHRDRILTEYADHLTCDPSAQLGSPADLARQFADELGTSRARRGAAATFAALARGVAEAGACLLGFAALGPYVGLWMPA